MVVPRSVVSAIAYLEHRGWLAKPGKNGKPHNANPMRTVKVDYIWIYEESWPLLLNEAADRPPVGRFSAWAYELHKAHPLPRDHPQRRTLENMPTEKVPASKDPATSTERS